MSDDYKAAAAAVEKVCDLDGFGCACLPTRMCGTCEARETLRAAIRILRGQPREAKHV